MMKFRYTSAVMVALAAGSLASNAMANDLFVFVEESQRLAPDPSANDKDSLDVELADVDGDGDLDVFLVEGSSSTQGFQNQLWINDGAGNFTDETALRLPAILNNSTEVDFADIDGDGDLDAVVANLGDNQLLENDGNGYFTDVSYRLPQAAPPGPPGFAVPFPPFFVEVSAEAVFVDVDGDGDQDILISNENPFPFGPPGDQNRLLINDGTGTFSDQTASRLPMAIDNSAGFVAGDIDGDGDTDLIGANIGQNIVLINDGTGAFADETATRLPVAVNSTRKLALGDLDGDGDLDIVEGNSRGQQDRLYLNDGAGVFVDNTAAAMPVDTSTNTDIDLVDLNGDGKLDIFVTNVGDFVFNHGFLGEPNRIYLNDGHALFRDATFPRLALRNGRSTNAEFGDVDGDGVADVIVANSGGVDQPGLPPPDGAERLFLGRPCDSYTTVCLQTMLDGLSVSADALDTQAAPNGDMTSTNATVNAVRKALLQSRVEGAQAALDGNHPILLGVKLLQVGFRVDGQGAPPDWVSGSAASSLFGYDNFALQVLAAYGL